MQSGRIDETIRFTEDADAQLTYVLEQSETQGELSILYRPQAVTVLVPASEARDWAAGSRVGIYGDVDLGTHKLSLIVEKDFACLDGSERDNLDTFPNPKKGTNC
jgi:hypothetical protein